MAATVSQFRNKIMPYVPGCPIPTIDLFVVDAMRTFCEETKIFTKMIGATGNPPSDEFAHVLSFTLTEYDTGDFYIVYIDLGDYSVLSGYDPVNITFFTIDGIETKLSYMSMSAEVTNMDMLVPLNTKFYEFADTDELRISPFMTEAEAEVDLEITIALKPADGSTSVDDRFFNEWREPIISLASSNLQRLPKRNWTDLVQADINWQKYQKELSKINSLRFSTYFQQTRQPSQWI